jgi:hypothetical protein
LIDVGFFEETSCVPKPIGSVEEIEMERVPSILNGGTRFVVLSTQRSGSTWLIDILNSIEHTTAYGELFLRRKARMPPTNLVKIRKDDYADVITNYEEAREALAGSEFAALIGYCSCGNVLRYGLA